MPRKTTEVKIDDPASRDHGRLYFLTEMPASRAEKWAARALLALSKGNPNIPEDIEKTGMAGLAVVGFQMLAGLDFAEADALMDEMMTCVQYVPDPARPETLRRLMEDDVDEVATRVRLRSEVFTLHTGFSLAAVPSMLISAMGQAASSGTPTSRGSSEQ